jgi:VRR-NUC domain
VKAIIDIGTIEVRRSQRDLWRAGGLMPEWKLRFPELFDEQDVGIAENQPDCHFWEWLAAIVLYHATGYRALVEKYAYANRPRKQEIVAKLLPDDVLRVLRDRTEHGSTQGPDLLMYAPDMSDWFFCEVKGPGDRLRQEQMSKFEALARASGKPVRLLHLKSTADMGRTPAGPTVPP